MLNFNITTQPDGVTCGPTCLHAIYQYYSTSLSIEQVIKEAPMLETGGTLAILLACDALRRGFQATLHSFNLYVLDPTWFSGDTALILNKLRIQWAKTTDSKIKIMTQAYIEYLELGGKLSFGEISFAQIQTYLERGVPLLSGVCATYLYKDMRDYTSDDNQVVYDEWLGAPTGHFVILKGCEPESQRIHLADPYAPHPSKRSNYHTVDFLHWLHAFLLGVMTNDAELLAIEKVAT